MFYIISFIASGNFYLFALIAVMMDVDENMNDKLLLNWMTCIFNKVNKLAMHEM